MMALSRQPFDNSAINPQGGCVMIPHAPSPSSRSSEGTEESGGRLEWAQSLVGRDWEIYWSEGGDGDDASIEDAPSDVRVQTPIPIGEPSTVQLNEENGGAGSNLTNGTEKSASDDTDDGETSEEGSIIDDWYAGHVKSMSVQDDNKFSFAVCFVGEDIVYDMVLDKTKVRPSARGWIKRSKALLSISSRQGENWEEELPLDTRTLDDESQIAEIQRNSYIETFHDTMISPDGASQNPTQADLQCICRIRCLAQTQIYLRTRLAKIENHHGSTTVVDGEPNPTETYVDSLVNCLRDLERACTWFCRCWKLLEALFPAEVHGVLAKNLTFETIIEECLQAGRVALVSVASVDASPAASKRRQQTSPGIRRTKRRRKMLRFGNNPASFLETFDEVDFLSTSSVDQFVEALQSGDERLYLLPFGKMLQTLSHSIVDVVLSWRQRADILLNGSNNPVNEPISNGEESDDESEKDGDSDRASTEEMSADNEEHFVSVGDIESCLECIKNDPVLSRLDLSETHSKLVEKLTVIEEFETNARGVLSRLTEKSEATKKEDDNILKALDGFSKQALSSDGVMFNVDPLGKFSPPLTRDLLSDSIAFRRSMLDLGHAEHVRERLSFVEDLASRISSLPEVPSFGVGESELTGLRKRIQKLSSQYKDLLFKCDQYDSEVVNRPVGIGVKGSLISSAGAANALTELSKIPVVSIAEEKIAVRLDVITWKDIAGRTFQTDESRPQLSDLIELQQKLQLILVGKSQTRARLLKDVEENEAVDKAVRIFAADDVQHICGQLSKTVQTLHTKTSRWIDRAESVISSLRMHGNFAAGDQIYVQKLPAMVDLRRIRDLLDEHNDLEVDIPRLPQILENVQQNATKWAASLTTSIVEASNSFPMTRAFINEQRESRPKGLIMDPTRHTVDLLLDLLNWHQRVKEVLVFLADSAQASQQESPGSEDVDNYTCTVTEILYPLLLEGAEVVVACGESHYSEDKMIFSSARCVEVLEKLYNMKRTSRYLSREKLDTSPLGSAILDRMKSVENDLEEGAPMFVMLWFQWLVFVSDFVEGTRNEVDADPNSDFSLVAAQRLKSEEPLAEYDIPSQVRTLLTSKTSDLRKFDELMRDAEQAENGMRALLTSSKDFLRGSLENEACVREHFDNLKAMQLDFKRRLAGESGLILNPLIEPQLDAHIKIFGWLIKTFAYPILHLDEASYSNYATIDANSDSRVPWDVLMTLYDKMPSSSEERIGDFALVALRVGELYDAAKKWQEEITMNTMISIRGGKRRSPGSPAKSPQPDRDQSSKVEMDHVQRLAKNPILAKVAMPREGAVTGILRTSNQFDIQLNEFLGKDYDGSCPDRAAYPEADSLVGKRGEFILFRLTGSPMFYALKEALQSISHVAENVLAETPGKAAFEWIRKAIMWIEDLNAAVTSESPTGGDLGNLLVIPSVDAKRILKDGENIFLVVPEDLRRTMSKYGIIVSTNKQDGTLKVVFKKGGAHHSIGGTAIRWCPLLFESLKNDVARLVEWETELTMILTSFNEFYSSTKSDSKAEEENLMKWYEFDKLVSDLVEERLYSLVVSPPKGLVASFRKLLDSIRRHLEAHSTQDVADKFARQKYEDGLSVVDDRGLLLDSLLYRRSIPKDPKSQIFPDDPPHAEHQVTFRDTCREYLEKALNKGVTLLNIGNDVQAHASNFCALKAWEIENELFEEFQSELGISRVSDGYRSKARSLRYNLEDSNNPTLAPRVILGDIETAALIAMTPDELASNKAKCDRAKAEEEAKRNVLLTPDTSLKTTASGEPGTRYATSTDQNMSSEQSGSPDPIVKSDPSDTAMAEKKTSPPVGTTTDKVDNKDNDYTSEKELSPSSFSHTSALSVEVAHSPLSCETDLPDGTADKLNNASIATTIKAMSKAHKSSRPPPPPSLAASTKDLTTTVTGTDRGKRVTTSSGGDKFRIEIMKPKVTFSAGFFLEAESHQGVNGYVPERLTEKGRLRIDAFQDFLLGKLRGGRWRAIPLRLTTFSDRDAQEYKTYYKEYELNKRISMFAVGENCKIFLVTPRFHTAATRDGMVSLMSKTSSYAIVLTKDRLPIS